MNKGIAYAIFNDIKSEKYTPIEKVIAINEILGMETHNSVTKEKIIDAFRWFCDSEEIEQPKTDWIPFNEPPKEDDTYIVAWLPIGLDCKVKTKHYYALWEFENDEWEIDVPESYKNFEIIGIAWQPLPQPYKKEGAE